MKAKRSNQSVSTKSSHPRNKNVIFISYSHEDREWMDRLAGHLAVLQSQNLLTLWADRRIGAGSEWEREIKEAIEQSSVAILLITANFLRSKFIMGVEIPRLLQRREREGVEIIPGHCQALLLEACRMAEPYEHVPQRRTGSVFRQRPPN